MYTANFSQLEPVRRRITIQSKTGQRENLESVPYTVYKTRVRFWRDGQSKQGISIEQYSGYVN